MLGHISIQDENYPLQLRQITNPPKQLFYKGNFEALLNMPCIAIVGSRRCSQYGEHCAKKFTKILSQYGIVIISGFMYGIDSAAHISCI